MKSLTELYSRHLESVMATLEDLLVKEGCDRIVIDAGPLVYRYDDDQGMPFRSYHHFAYLIPAPGPRHLLLWEPGVKPHWLRFVAGDFWYDRPPDPDSYWRDHYTCTTFDDEQSLWRAAEQAGKRTVYLGPRPLEAQAKGWDVNPAAILNALAWRRSFKTEYEIECISEANRIAAAGHKAARDAFRAGGSEFEIHLRYLAACKQTESELPYPTIIGLGEKAGILHYESKRRNGKADTLLIDAGASFHGYGSDITRTYGRDQAPSLFHDLLHGLETIQQELVAESLVGVAHLDIHLLAHKKISQLLLATGLIRDAKASRYFFPHGVGHQLGLLVHDVAGKQHGPEGGSVQAPAEHPWQRSLRTLAPGMVVTVEPGIYFMPQLLEGAPDVNQAVLGELWACGGMRIEDDICITARGPVNLTRAFLA